LLWAIDGKNFNIFRKLLDKNVSLNNGRGSVALARAAGQGITEIARELINVLRKNENGLQEIWADHDGKSSMEIAIRGGHVSCWLL